MTGFKRLFFILAALVAAWGCGGKKGEPAGAGKGTDRVVSGVTVGEVAVTTVEETAELAGTVRARTSASVASRVAGSIALMRVREGDRVKKGELLARIDALESQAAAAASAAGIDEAGRALDEAVARKKLADITFERYQRLFAEQAVTRQELDVRQTEKEVAAQGVARAEARLNQARELSRGAGAIADHTRIVAPISGVITARHADPGSTVFPSQPVFTVEDEGSYLLELSLPETLQSRVRPGMKVQVSIDALPGSHALPISEVVPAADPASRTFIAKVPLPLKGLRSGMFGRGMVPVGRVANAVLVEKGAIVERGALTAVWVVDSGGVVRMRLVKVGKTVAGRIEVLAGLSPGERVVTSGAEKVSEGAKVE